MQQLLTHILFFAKLSLSRNLAKNLANLILQATEWHDYLGKTIIKAEIAQQLLVSESFSICLSPDFHIHNSQRTLGRKKQYTCTFQQNSVNFECS